MRRIRLQSIRVIRRFGTVNEAIGSIESSPYFSQIASVSAVVKGSKILNCYWDDGQIWIILSENLLLHLWQDINILLCSVQYLDNNNNDEFNQKFISCNNQETVEIEFYDKQGIAFDLQRSSRSRVISSFLDMPIQSLYESDGLIGLHFKGHLQYPIFSPMWNIDSNKPYIYWYIDSD